MELGRHVYRGEKGEGKAFRGKREAEYRSLVVEKLGLSEEEAADEDNETLYKALKVRYLCMFRMALVSSLSLIARRLSHTISPILPAARFARRPSTLASLAAPSSPLKTQPLMARGRTGEERRSSDPLWRRRLRSLT
jgi:hypothetical protein